MTAAALVPTPPMGWNSWNRFRDRIDDAAVRAQADAMVSSGMRDAGYTYVNVDDTWQGERGGDGVIRPNARFPDMKALSDYIHGKGLKFGLYSSPGRTTCAGYEGSYGHERQDAETYAAWGVDFLKYDLCSLDDDEMKPSGSFEAAHAIQVVAYRRMADALTATGRPIVYSLCQYGFNQVWRWGQEVGGHLWRTTGDITDDYARMMAIGLQQAGLAPFAGPGRWNDPDMLEVGNGGMTGDEYRSHMSLWALLAAPLIAGNDLSTMSEETRDILTHREVIAIDQDSLGKQGDRLMAEGSTEVWARPLAGGDAAVGLFNLAERPAWIEADLAMLGFSQGVQARDVWTAEEVGEHRGSIRRLVAPHAVALLRLRRAESVRR